ncbi:hypothetical protein [Ruegeria sp. HKCCD7255]|uniref:hypothetical protein n=1 Tax=Ruegeria sp. HKCCD7255 TaxID=2683004 RepID=UPI001489FE43|nr:hypothetical protein [Ruegeria sp. HKCCD7255]
MADKVLAASDEIHIADYGCGTGSNAILSIKPAVKSFADRYPGRAIYVHHVDQAENDWNTLFECAAGQDGYITLSSNVRPVASMGSFFSMAAPASSIDVGTSFGASHWLSLQPSISSKGALWFADLQGEARLELKKQAQRDWETFLTMRLRELRRGGRLMVSTLGAIPDAGEVNGICSSGRHTYRAMYHVAETMVNDGLISEHALRDFLMPIWFMSREETLEPFQRNKDLADGFSIERAEVVPAQHNPKDIFADQINAPQEYAASYKGFVRSFTESTFRHSLLRGETDQTTKANLNEFYDRFETLIKNGAGKYAFEIWLLTIELRKQ